jgi:hypothetical protein
MFLRFMLLLLVCFSAGCVRLESGAERAARAARLKADLALLGASVDTREAALLAEAAVEKSASLAADYQPFRLQWMNNGLVNAGLRKRGLCWHWRDDLFPHLYALRLSTLEVHLASARRGRLLEHNGIVVTAKGQAFRQGIVLDPWRSGGVLSWAVVASDRYPWEPLPPDLTPDSIRPILKKR